MSDLHSWQFDLGNAKFWAANRGNEAMGRPLRIEYPGAFYHVTSRGNERKAIYKSARDREKFLEYLESASVRYGARLLAY